MEHLNKQQIILLALLVSFVTSIATGIVTVSLINQAPAGTTNTVERIIEDSVAAALPSDNLAAVSQSGSSADSLTAAIGAIRGSIVEIGTFGSTNGVSGLGIVVNARGTNGEMYSQTLPVGGKWSGWDKGTGLLLANTDPAPSATGDVYVIGNDISHSMYRLTAGKWTSLGYILK